MYIGAFFIGDLLINRRHIDRRYLGGKKKVKKHMKKFEGIRQPPDAAWAEFKAFIFRNYLINGYEVYPRLQKKANISPNVKYTEKEKLMNMKKGTKLIDTIRNLPRELREILHELEFPADDGIDIALGILEGNALGACDGSLHQKDRGHRGGYGFSIQLKQGDKNSIKGWSPTPLTNKMTSLTSEFYGALATMLLLFVVQLQYNDLLRFTKNNKIVVWIDNKDAIKRSAELQERMNVSEMMVPEYDIEKLVWDIKSLLPFQVKLMWVKSHQNETKDGKPIFGPFCREVQLNCEVDELAKRGSALTPRKREIYTHTVAGIYDSNNVLATDVYKYLYDKINGPKIWEYIGAKFNWEEEQLQTINWESLGKVMRTYSQFQRNKIIQLMYDWQNDGSQKVKFAQTNGKCPGCEQHETHLHFVSCPHKKMIDARKRALNALSVGLRSINTYPGSIALITNGLCTNFEEAMKSIGIPKSYKDVLLLEAAMKQHDLENHAMHRGMIVRHWETVQSEWCREIGARYDSVKWSVKVIRLLHTYTRAIWNARNEILHGENVSESIELRKAKCKERIRALYKHNRKCLTPTDKKLFHLPMRYRQKGSIAGMTLWIDRVEMIFQDRMNKEDLAQKGLITWWFPKSQKWKRQTSSDPG